MTVTVFSKPGCMPCTMTKNALDKLGVDYQAVDVTQDQASYERVVELGYRQMPVVLVGEEHWSGFQPEKINHIKELMHA